MEKKLIGICGGSGSGKTTLANAFVKQFKGEASILAMDDYYLPIEQQQLDENNIPNFDLPTAIDTKKFVHDLNALKTGNSVFLERYSFNNPNLEKEEFVVESMPFLFTEGIFLFQDQRVLGLLDFLIFVDTDVKVMFSRRKKRDAKERSISAETIEYQWEKHFMPAYYKYVYPFKSHSNMVVNGNEDFDLEDLKQRIKKALSV